MNYHTGFVSVSKYLLLTKDIMMMITSALPTVTISESKSTPVTRLRSDKGIYSLLSGTLVSCSRDIFSGSDGGNLFL